MKQPENMDLFLRNSRNKKMISLKSYILNQIKEIKSSKALVYFGAFLSFTHIVTFQFWNHLSFYHFSTSGHPSNICWPFFSSCGFLKFPSVLFSQIAFFFYLCIAFLSVYLFLLNKVKQGYFTLLFLNLFKYMVLLFSFKHMGNYHYMPLIVSFLYLLFPKKKTAIPIMISLFYLFAGFLKLNNLEWFSGGSLWGIRGWNNYIIVFLTSSVVFLELFISPLLLLKHWLKYLAFFFFCVFHLASFYWVGYFYPINCFALLFIFPLIWFLDKTHENLIEKVIKNKIPKSLFVVFILFIMAQILPRFYRGDEAVTGQGRTWSLNMYDARVSCHSYMKLRYKNRTEEFSRNSRWLSIRIQCDPHVYFSDAKKACLWAEKNPDFLDIDFYLTVKRKSDMDWKSLVELQNFCSKDVSYHFLRGNQWINF